MNKSLEQITCDLIKIRSTNKYIHNKKVILTYMMDYFRPYSEVKMHYFDFFSSPCLLVAKELFISYDVIFCMHLDVVEGEDIQFAPYIENGRIYGRGAADMKGPSATIIKTFEELLASSHADKIALLFTTDEESASSEGKNAILDSRIQSKCVVIADTKSYPQDHLVNECKGIVFMKLSTRATNNIGAIELLIDDLFKIRQLFSNEKSEWKATLNISKIESSHSLNEIPQIAEALLDIRTTKDQNIESFLINARKILEFAHIEMLQNYSAVYIDQKNIYFQTMKYEMEQILKKEVAVFKEEGSSDARFFSQKEIPQLLCKPLTDGLHVADEWIDIASMYQYKQIYSNFCKNTLFLEN